MINEKLARFLILALIAVTLIHSATRIFLGHTGYDVIALLLSNVLWITLYLFFYLCADNLKLLRLTKFSIIVLILVQVFTSLIIGWANSNMRCMILVANYMSLILSAIQILALGFLGSGILISNKDTVVRYLGYAFLIQGIVTLLVFITSMFARHLLYQRETAAMMSGLLSVMLDAVDILVLLYMFRVCSDYCGDINDR